MTRPWVREHDQPVWHWFGCGHFAYAACGMKPIPGSPNVSDERPETGVCPRCSELFDLQRGLRHV